MRQISIGKYRRMQRCSSRQGTFAILAIDHRTSLIKGMGWDSNEGETAYALAVQFKKEIVSQLSEMADAVLLDPEYGAAQSVVYGVLPKDIGLIISIESSGYKGEKHLRESELLAGWSVEKSVRLGADGVKLLVYYHPEAGNAAHTEQLVSAVAEECQKWEIPLFLEPVTYSLQAGQTKEGGAARQRVVVETARRLSALDVDVLKMEFPLDIEQDGKDHDRWYEACAELTQASKAPWILLSAAVDYEVYLEQVRAACRGGASGIAVGRAVWKEAQTLKEEWRTEFLSNIARQRMQELALLCATLGRSWWDNYTVPLLEERWYERY